MTTTRLQPVFPRKAQGAVLFVALVFLILITLLALTAASTSVLQERMTGGMRNSQLGLMGSESSARGAEAWLWNLSNNSSKVNCGLNGGSTGFCFKPQSDGTGGFSHNALVDQFRSATTWLTYVAPGGTGGMGQYVASMTGLANAASLSKQPQYILEEIGLVLPAGAQPNGQGGSTQRDSITCRAAGCQSLISYRVTARSTGGSDASVRTTEVYFGAGVPSN
jgi:type IV pilus assembly protein PilX